MANTYTIHFHLPKPDKGDLDWDDEYHEAMDIVDAQLKSVNDSLTNHTSNTNNPHSTSFIQLTDTPSSYSGLANRVVVVNSTATGLTTVTRVPLAEDSNKVGGLYPGNSANNVLKLDSTGKVPLSNLPISLYDADNDGIVDKAEAIDDGTYTATAQEIKDAVNKKHTQGTDTTLGKMTADIDMNFHKITNVTDPTSAQDVATKNYVDSKGMALDQVVLGVQIFS